jgi:hypothetical protein
MDFHFSTWLWILRGLSIIKGSWQINHIVWVPSDGGSQISNWTLILDLVFVDFII